MLFVVLKQWIKILLHYLLSLMRVQISMKTMRHPQKHLCLLSPHTPASSTSNLIHQTDYPILARMAFDIFSIPAMSSEVERVFSAAKKLITDERNCLGAEAVEACETQRHWLKALLVD